MLFVGEGEASLPRSYGAGGIERLSETSPPKRRLARAAITTSDLSPVWMVMLAAATVIGATAVLKKR